jgi:hypothetical protein
MCRYCSIAEAFDALGFISIHVQTLVDCQNTGIFMKFLSFHSLFLHGAFIAGFVNFISGGMGQ